MTKKAIIIGAGPAGLTAAYQLLNTTDIIPEISCNYRCRSSRTYRRLSIAYYNRYYT